MNRRVLLVVVVGMIGVASAVSWRTKPSRAEPVTGASVSAPADAKASLPITQVTLFSSGVAGFLREGNVEGDSRVELLFPAADINDLLKSLVIQDSGGKVSTVTYDGYDTAGGTLRSFALDLADDPTFGQLLDQARGEKVELTFNSQNNNRTESLSGTLVGIESRPVAKASPVEFLMVLSPDGMRSVPLAQVVRVKFLNAALEAELKKALEVLAAAHATHKKAVTVRFSGQGKRQARLGYVVESPIWKTSYRLVLDKNGKAFLQGWALIDNATEDDWNNVRLTLVSGRPISFQMDLHPPLYVPRPIVEPDLFASLRPPEYTGPLTAQEVRALPSGALGGLGGLGGALGALGAAGGVGGMAGRMPRPQAGDSGDDDSNGPSKARWLYEKPRLTYDEYEKRRLEKQQEGKAASDSNTANFREGVVRAATAEEVAGRCRYTIDHGVTLPRQKSALVPIVDQAVPCSRVSIFNKAVDQKFPLFGFKFKNQSGQSLMQGPIAVYDQGAYAGDARIADLQPNEERLLGYAVDLGMEVKATTTTTPPRLAVARIQKGTVEMTDRLREATEYALVNRSPEARVLLLEHPLRRQWRLLSPPPAERARDVYRFQVKVAAGAALRHLVTEESDLPRKIEVSSLDEPTMALLLHADAASPALKAAIAKTKELQARLSQAQAEHLDARSQLTTITADQARLRANLAYLPTTSSVYKRYFDKFDAQESEIEKLQSQIKRLRETADQRLREFNSYVSQLSVD